MRRKIIIALLLLFACSAAGAGVAILYIRSTTLSLRQLVRLHQIQDLRRDLVIATQAAQSDLFTVHTSLGSKLDTVLEDVGRLEVSAKACSGCHHDAPIATRLAKVQGLIGEYETALSYYITVSANRARAERLQLQAAAIGSRLLGATEEMSADASRRLESRTTAAMARIDEAGLILAVSLGLSLLFSVAVAIHLTRSVTYPVGQLMAATRELAAGKLGSTVVLEDDTEFGELGGHFNHMSRALKASYAELQRQVQERVDAEQRLVHDALHDALTGLPNRVLFLDRLDQVFQAGRRQPEIQCAVLFLDIDRFKVINDSLGHLIGDQLLVAVGQRIAVCLRATDTVARLGGDEFGVLVTDIHDLGGALHLARRILAELEQAFVVEGNEIFARASIGIALRSERHERPEQVLRDADVAMYQAKLKGRGGCEVFDAEMHASVVERLGLEADLRRAIEHGDELLLHFQPIVRLRGGGLSGLEALVRWRHPERGLLLASEFIPLAEESGMIIPIGEWVMEQACRQLRVWQDRNPAFEKLILSINISGRQFRQADVVARMAAIWRRTGISPASIALELTETTIMENMDSCAEKLGQLRSMGAQVHIDDFGTGYSSLSYLHRFPVTAVKMDRSFVTRLPSHGDSVELIGAVLSIAESLHLNVVAEGIESAAQLARLADLRCVYGQGFFFARPMPAEQVEQWMAGLPASPHLASDGVPAGS